MVDDTAADAPVAADKNVPAADKKPKYKRPPTIGGARKPRGINPELEMLGELGSQAQNILRLALAVEGGDTSFNTFSDYLTFRGKISEFEAFCSVIESHLKDVVAERRQELEDRFYTLWSMIFRPSLRALTRFFDRLVEEQVLPLGGKDLLNTELRALEGMRSILAAPRFAAVADKAMLEELKHLEATLSQLAEHATSLPDLAQRPGTADDEPAEAGEQPVEPEAVAAATAAAPTPPAPPPRPDTSLLGDLPNVKAVRELKGLLEYYKRDKALRNYVDIDTRAVDEIERKLVVNPMDPAAVVWMRQICNAWASRLRDNDKDIRRVLAMIRSA